MKIVEVIFINELRNIGLFTEFILPDIPGIFRKQAGGMVELGVVFLQFIEQDAGVYGSTCPGYREYDVLLLHGVKVGKCLKCGIAGA